VDDTCQLQCDEGYMPDSHNFEYRCNLNEKWTPVANTVNCEGNPVKNN